MTLDEFIQVVRDGAGPILSSSFAELEEAVEEPLPEDYRHFLERCNGGRAYGGLKFAGPTAGGDPVGPVVDCVGGLGKDAAYPLLDANTFYAELIPADLMWIMDDPFGDAICLGVRGRHKGHVYVWNHELAPDPQDWDRQVETAENLSLIANSFTAFVEGLEPHDLVAPRPRPIFLDGTPLQFLNAQVRIGIQATLLVLLMMLGSVLPTLWLGLRTGAEPEGVLFNALFFGLVIVLGVAWGWLGFFRRRRAVRNRVPPLDLR